MKLEVDPRELEKALDALDKFGGAKARQKFKNAFNRAGFDTRKRMIEHIGSVFKNPNQYTRNSLYFKQLTTANDKKDAGELAFRKKETGKGVGAGIYLMPQEWGGSRANKGFELKLQRMGFLKPGMFAVPTTAVPAKLRTASGLFKLAADIDRVMMRVNAGAKKGRAQRENYFVIMRKTGNLGAGIYMRSSGKVIRLFAFVDKVSYKKIFRFYEKAQKEFTELFITKLKDEVSKG